MAVEDTMPTDEVRHRLQSVADSGAELAVKLDRLEAQLNRAEASEASREAAAQRAEGRLQALEAQLELAFASMERQEASSSWLRQELGSLDAQTTAAAGAAERAARAATRCEEEAFARQSGLDVRFDRLDHQLSSAATLVRSGLDSLAGSASSQANQEDGRRRTAVSEHRRVALDKLLLTTSRPAAVLPAVDQRAGQPAVAALFGGGRKELAVVEARWNAELQAAEDRWSQRVGQLETEWAMGSLFPATEPRPAGLAVPALERRLEQVEAAAAEATAAVARLQAAAVATDPLALLAMSTAVADSVDQEPASMPGNAVDKASVRVGLPLHRLSTRWPLPPPALPTRSLPPPPALPTRSLPLQPPLPADGSVAWARSAQPGMGPNVRQIAPALTLSPADPVGSGQTAAADMVSSTAKYCRKCKVVFEGGGKAELNGALLCPRGHPKFLYTDRLPAEHATSKHNQAAEHREHQAAARVEDVAAKVEAAARERAVARAEVVARAEAFEQQNATANAEAAVEAAETEAGLARAAARAEFAARAEAFEKAKAETKAREETKVREEMDEVEAAGAAMEAAAVLKATLDADCAARAKAASRAEVVARAEAFERAKMEGAAKAKEDLKSFETLHPVSQPVPEPKQLGNAPAVAAPAVASGPVPIAEPEARLTRIQLMARRKRARAIHPGPAPAGPPTSAPLTALQASLVLDEVAELQAWFGRYDSDGNGRLGVAEVEVMLREASYGGVDPLELRRVFRKYDHDDSGTISFDEFVPLFGIISHPEKEKRVRSEPCPTRLHLMLCILC